jgi:hypothetical protein
VKIYITNASTLVSDTDVRTMTSAIQQQVSLDLAPAWNIRIPTVTAVRKDFPIPPRAFGLTIVDTISDTPDGTLGYHTEDPGGRQWGTVAVEPVKSAGGHALTGDWSLSSVLSHEVLEAIIDPRCNLWANNNAGRAYSYEICDPVEAPTYVVSDVSVSNFVYPAWFDPMSAAHPLFDHLGMLKKPFSILPQGYCVYVGAGKEHQVFGDRFPAWRKEMKRYSRTARLVRQLRTHDEGQ